MCFLVIFAILCIIFRIYAKCSYKCYNRTNVPGKCDGQASFSVEKLDNLVDQIIRIQLTQIQKAPPQALLEKQRGREADLARAKVKRLQSEYQQKQRDYQDLRAETLKVIQGNSQFGADLLNSLMDETAAQLKGLEGQMQTAELELREAVSGVEQVKKEYTQLMNWAELYDNCTFEAKKMIVAQFVKAVHVKRGYELDIDLPGYKKDEINVQLEHGQLTIQAAKSVDKEEKDKEGKYIRRERYAGAMSRSFYVGEAVEKNEIHAKFENGILKLSVPKKDSKAVEENRYIAIEG